MAAAKVFVGGMESKCAGARPALKCTGGPRAASLRRERRRASDLR